MKKIWKFISGFFVKWCRNIRRLQILLEPNNAGKISLASPNYAKM